MELTVNGHPATYDAPLTIADLVAEVLGGETRGSAVAHNGEVVPRASHAVVALADGDVVEIVTAVQGG
jgi:sulfur carrier protein